MHEDFTRKEAVQGSSDRSFGFVMAAFFGIVALWPLLHGPLSSIRWWALAIAAAFLALALLWTAPLRPLNRLWLKLGLLLSKVVSPVVLMVLFYATVTPIGVLMRWTGKDPLRLRRNSAVASYWIPREPPGPAPDSMKQQF
jgi:predicted membrane metal-binding protein